MGKGKKKDKKKPESKQEEGDVAPIASLSLGEPEASTSSTNEQVQQEKPEPPKPEPPKPEPPKEEDDDEGGLGLGISRSKKRRPKKKADKDGAKPSSAPTGPAPEQSIPAVASATAWGQPSQAPPQAPPPSEPMPHSGLPGVQARPSTAGDGVPPGSPAGFPSLNVVLPSPVAGPSAGPSPGPSAWPGLGGPTRPEPQPPMPTSTAPAFQPRQTPSGGGGREQTQPQQGTRQTTSQSRQTPPTETTTFRIPQKIPRSVIQCRTARVLVNYLQMEFQPFKIHRYDVSFKPDKPKKFIPKAYGLAKAKLFPTQIMAFDQMKNCYVLQPLPNVTQTERLAVNVEIVDPNGRKLKFEVSFKGTGIVDLGTIKKYMQTGGTSLNPPTEAIQCVDVILRQGTLENYIKAGRQFFKRPSRPIDLGDGLEMWTGLFQSAIFTSMAFVNIDVAHKGFPKHQRMTDAIVNDFKLALDKPVESQRGRGVEAFLNFVKGLRVIAAIGGDSSSKGQRREFMCNGLKDPPGRMSFPFTDSNGKATTITVYDYFVKEKKIRLQYPNFNCMWVGPPDKKIFYPMELLQVSYGQAQNKQLNDNQLSTMVRQAATPPDERKRKIEEVIRDMNYPSNPHFKHFGLAIKNEFTSVDAKILTPPALDIGLHTKTVTPAKGQWQANHLLKPENLENWAFIAIESNPDSCNGELIIKLLKSGGAALGMRVNEPRERFYNTPMNNLKDVLTTCVAKSYKFAVVIVPARLKDCYHRVKQVAEREVGILTQCIKEATGRQRMNPQTAKNLLLKINSKLMGINQAIDKRCVPRCLVNCNVMLVGADVTHPSPEQTAVPSIAAVTASIDPRCFIYNIQLSIQTPKKEMIVEFEDMMVEHLKVYRNYQGVLPTKIFVFRDGVSEGQFAQVMNSELQAVHKAYQRMTGTTKKPEVLFLLVQKRHHTRLFPADLRNASQNVEPGTVVDTHIVHARELDFYLVSHQAIKGTARPTRYHAVCNDGGIPDVEVEQLTYYLCHLFSRCMRSVSYPTPTYYAHLACLRARSLTYGERFDNESLERNPKRLKVMDNMLATSRMFYV